MAKKTPSQQRWLKRQHSDIYVKKAHLEGYRSRAAYKLKEIQEKYKLIKKGMHILDLGAAPGSWSQVALELGAKVIGIDLLPIVPLEGAVFIQGDFRSLHCHPERSEAEGVTESKDLNQALLLGPSPSAQDDLHLALAKQEQVQCRFDGILSDISPSTCGIPKVDHLKLVGMLEDMMELFPKYLKSDGFFVCKVFKGGMQSDLLKLLKQSFKKVTHFKPKSSRAESPEEYLIAQGYIVYHHEFSQN